MTSSARPDAPEFGRPLPTFAIIDVSRTQLTRGHKALLVFADLALAFFLVLAIPVVLIAVSLPLVWLVRAATGLVNLF